MRASSSLAAPATPALRASACRGRPPRRHRRCGRRPRRPSGGGQRAVGVGQLGHGADSRDQPGGTVVEGVVGHREGPPRAQHRRETVQVVLAVVATDQHLEHRLVLGHAGLEPLGEEPDDLLRDRGQRVDPLGAVRGVGIGSERRHLVADPGQHARALGVDQRLVEPAEARAAGQVADHGEPQLGGPAPDVRGGCAPGRPAPRPAEARRSSAGAARSRGSTSGPERCCARKIRNTASSSCGVRSSR